MAADDEYVEQPTDQSVTLPVAGTYIRGGQGQATTDRNVGNVVAWFCLVSLLATVVALTIGAARHESQQDQLRAHGVPVSIRVTSCVAFASGTGVTSDGFRCNGTFSFAGQQRTEVLRGVPSSSQTGRTVAGIVDSKDPSIASFAFAVSAKSSGWKPYVVPAILFVIFDIGLVAMVIRSRRSRAASPSTQP